MRHSSYVIPKLNSLEQHCTCSLSQNSCVAGIWECPAKCFCLCCSPEDVSLSCSAPKAGLSQEDCLLSDSPMGCWQKVPVPCHMDVFVGLVADFPRESNPGEKAQWKPNVFHDLGNHTLSFCQCPTDHTDKLCLGWKGTPNIVNDRKRVLLEASRENGRPFCKASRLSHLSDKTLTLLRTCVLSQ